MKSIALFNPRGGVGKTSLSVNLAAALGRLGKKVILIDFDPESHVTSFLEKNLPQDFKSLYHFLKGESVFEQIIFKHNLFDYVPAEIRLANFNTSFKVFHKSLNKLKKKHQKLEQI